jgi:serine protease Do
MRARAGFALFLSTLFVASTGCKRIGFIVGPPGHQTEVNADNSGEPASGAAAMAPVAPADSASPAPAGLEKPAAPPPIVLPGTPDIATLVAKVSPAVVNITSTHELKTSDLPFPQLPAPFSEFFGGGPRGDRSEGSPRRDRVIKQQALGSGFIVDKIGTVVTNAHVVEGADDVKVTLSDDREFHAKVKGRDPRLDIAVLELEGAKDLPTVAPGSSDALRVGDYVVAIGNPFGLGNTVTMGIVSAKSRTIGAGPYDDFIQTDASINPGNSGGPLFDLRGQVVGINTAINPNGQGIGFAIPIDDVKDVVPQLLKNGQVSRGRLGVVIQPVDANMAKALGLDRTSGALVAEVESNGPADKAGLRAGDLIVGVDDVKIAHSEELPRVVARHAPGSEVTVHAIRDKSEHTFQVSLGELSANAGGREGAPKSPEAQNGTEAPGIGIEVRSAPSGGAAVLSVKPGGAADERLLPGDVIVELNHAPVRNADDLAAGLKAAPQGQPMLFRIQRKGQSLFVAVDASR